MDYTDAIKLVQGIREKVPDITTDEILALQLSQIALSKMATHRTLVNELLAMKVKEAENS